MSLHPPREGEPADATRPGVTRVCTVRIRSAVVNWERPLRKERLHTWIPRPTEGAAAEIVFCLITDPDVDLPLDDASLVGELANDQVVRMLAFLREVRANERMRLAVDMGPDATDADLAQVRAVAMGRLAEDGSVVLEEVVGEWK